VRGANWSTFWKKEKRSVQLATFRRSTNFVLCLVKNVRRRKLSSFNMTTRGLTLHVWLCRQFKRTAGNCSPIHPTVRICPPSDYHMFGLLKDHLRIHHYETDEAVHEAVRSWLRGAGTDFYSRDILRFCNAGRNT
jgi:hypothetical protein